jgi:hypothetical protein
MNRPAQIIRAGVLIAAIVVVNGCGAFLGGTFSGCDSNLDGIVAMLQPTLPASATVLDESCVEGFAPGNATVRVTFTMSPDDLETFQQSTPVKEWENAAPADYTYGGATISPSSALYGEYGDGAIYTEILIDTSDPALYTVYYSNSFID